MSDSLVGIIRIFPYQNGLMPEGWMFCDGRILSVATYQSLFNIIGKRYGGDGISTFCLPNLAGKVPVGVGALSPDFIYTLGQQLGSDSISLNNNQLPAHSHPILGDRGSGAKISSAAGTQSAPSASVNTLGAFTDTGTGGAGNNAYNNATPAVLLNAGPAFTALINPTGWGQPVPVIQPTMSLMYAICVNDGTGDDGN